MITVNNLTYIYQPDSPFVQQAITDISLHIDEGEFVGIIGRTGSGKSTLIQHLNGLLKPTSGEVIIDDVNIFSSVKTLREVRQKVGLVFQFPEYQLFEETVYKDIAFGPKNMGLDADEIDRRVRLAAKTVGVEDDLLEKSPFSLSGGQKRRVAIAGVLAMQPKVLVLDEPTAGLDPKGRGELLDCLKKLHAEQGITVILVSHSMEDIAQTVDRIIVLSDGKVFLQGSVSEVFSDASRIQQIGLDAPQIKLLADQLTDVFGGFDTNIFTVEACADEIVRRVGL